MPALGLFDAFGVELEYMIVDASTLDARAIADEVFRAATGEITGELEAGPISWSNELALHVIELKTTDPARELGGLAERFAENIARINALLAPMGARLMPTAMHPWMDPMREMRLWPHDYSPVYEAFNRIFDCRGHGWANLQSVHINLPFASDVRPDDEFGRLHAAIRLLLPILPALAASSPIVEGRTTGTLDNRLDVYRGNARRIPSVSGAVIPEPVFTRADYERKIFARMYEDIRPHDPEGVLQHEWLNARGAIARFDRGAIEIRVLDIGESPYADMAIVTAIVEVLRAMVDERFSPLAEQQQFDVGPLAAVLLQTIREGERAVIADASYLRQFGIAEPAMDAAGIWRSLVDCLSIRERLDVPCRNALDRILAEGPLARRLLARLGTSPTRTSLKATYGELCDAL